MLCTYISLTRLWVLDRSIYGLECILDIPEWANGLDLISISEFWSVPLHTSYWQMVHWKLQKKGFQNRGHLFCILCIIDSNSIC